MVGIDSLNVQQANEIAGKAWASLELWNQIAAFLEFLQVSSQLLMPLTLVHLVWICSICSLEWIRFTSLHPISVIMKIWSLIHTCTQSFQNKKKPIFCVQTCLARFDLIVGYSWTWNVHKISRFKWFWYFHDFIWFNWNKNLNKWQK